MERVEYDATGEVDYLEWISHLPSGNKWVIRSMAGDKSDFILIFNQNGQLLEGVFASRITDKTRYCKAVYTYDSNGLAISKDLYGILWEGWHRPPPQHSIPFFYNEDGGGLPQIHYLRWCKTTCFKRKIRNILSFHRQSDLPV